MPLLVLLVLALPVSQQVRIRHLHLCPMNRFHFRLFGFLSFPFLSCFRSFFQFYLFLSDHFGKTKQKDCQCKVPQSWCVLRHVAHDSNQQLRLRWRQSTQTFHSQTGMASDRCSMVISTAVRKESDTLLEMSSSAGREVLAAKAAALLLIFGCSSSSLSSPSLLLSLCRLAACTAPVISHDRLKST